VVANSEERYERLMAEVEALKARRERAGGAADEVLARLAERGCKDEKAAESRLDRLEAEADRLELKVEKMLDRLEQELGG
jgi:hypothetical protein